MRVHPLSLSARLTLAASLALIAFLGATGAALDAAFRDSARTAVQDRLQGVIYTLLAAADLGADGTLFVPDETPEPRLSRPRSGLYAHVDGAGFEWWSASNLGVELPWPETMIEPGAITFEGPVVGDRDDDDEIFVLRMGVAWEAESGADVPFTLAAAESTAAYLGQIREFRRSLWGWLAAAGLVLLAVQGAVLRWSLRPLRTVSAELDAVQRGSQGRLQRRYPRELEGLTGGINAFIDSERKQLERFRNSLADLAHSLRTPLTVLRAALEADRGLDRDRLVGQVARMEDIVGYQLKRARTTGHRTFAQPVSVAECAEPVVTTLEQAYRDKQVACQFDLEPGVCFFGEAGDLKELLGNLLENAFKWCRREVWLSARRLAPGAPGCALELIVEDDGDGIEPGRGEALLARGVRGDERVQGHGIGLAVVRDIVDAYSGTIAFEPGTLGGARIVVRFPSRQ